MKLLNSYMPSQEKYQKDFQEFRTDDDCWNYLFEMRRPNGYQYSKCNSDKYWLTKKKLTHYIICEYQASVTAGTTFHGMRKPFILWLHFIWWIIVQKTGVNTYLTDFMSSGSYETAWGWSHLCTAMVRPEHLVRTRESDERYIGGKEIGKGKQSWDVETKSLVVVVTECVGKQIGRIWFRIISEASADELHPFITEPIEHRNTIVTDGWSEYSLSKDSEAYKHEVKTISGSGKQSHKLLPHVHMVDSLVKRWINGTHQRKISPKHLSYYLDEHAFRFNRKFSTDRGKLFYHLTQQAVSVLHKPYNELINRVA